MLITIIGRNFRQYLLLYINKNMKNNIKLRFNNKLNITDIWTINRKHTHLHQIRIALLGRVNPRSDLAKTIPFTQQHKVRTLLILSIWGPRCLAMVMASLWRITARESCTTVRKCFQVSKTNGSNRCSALEKPKSATRSKAWRTSGRSCRLANKCYISGTISTLSTRISI